MGWILFVLVGLVAAIVGASVRSGGLQLPATGTYTPIEDHEMASAQRAFFAEQDARLAARGFVHELTVTERTGAGAAGIHRFYACETAPRYATLSLTGAEADGQRFARYHVAIESRLSGGGLFTTTNRGSSVLALPDHVQLESVPGEPVFERLLARHDAAEATLDDTPVRRATSLAYLDAEYAAMMRAQVQKGLLRRSPDSPGVLHGTLQLRLRGLAGSTQTRLDIPGGARAWISTVLAPFATVGLVSWLFGGAALPMALALLATCAALGVMLGRALPEEAVVPTSAVGGLLGLLLMAALIPLHPLFIVVAAFGLLLEVGIANEVRQRREAPRYALATGHETARVERAQGQLSTPAEAGQLSPDDDASA